MNIGKKIERAQTMRDWDTRDCFQVLPHDDISGAIRLNIIGRDPDGQIEPRDVDDYVAQLTEDLLEITNMDTGQPFIRNVFRTKDMCWGERLDDLPDLFLEWNREAPISKIWSPKIGHVKRKQVAIRTGDHSPHCVVYARGPGIQTGAIAGTITHVDLAPTLTAMLGVSLNDVDGKPIPEMLSTELLTTSTQ